MKKIFSLGLVFLTLAVLTACTNAGTNQVAASTIAIDVNPSIVLELDENDKVFNVVMNNEDAEIIIGDMDLVGVDYKVAINALIGSMVANGYISEIANSILLSVGNEDALRESELMSELASQVNNVLSGSQITGSVIVQNLEFDEDAEELSERLDISEAKAELILEIIEVDPRMIVEELAELSINDLNLLLESKNIVLENVEKSGDASNLGLITVEAAYQAALIELGINDSDVLDLEIELEQEDGVMVYEVELETAIDEFEVLIDAKQGTVYVEVDDNDDEDDEAFPTNALTQEAVISLVANELGLDPALIQLDDFEQKIENGIAYFDIEFSYENKEYELEVDSLNGEIYTNSMDEDGFDHDDNHDESDDEDTEDED